jgi:DNA-binding NarL/FixJ family response regulator
MNTPKISSLRGFMAKSVLVVEDDVAMARSFAYSIGGVSGLELVATVHSVAEAQRFLKARPVDVCLVDLGLPDGSGLDVIKFATSLPTPVHVLVVSIFGDEQNIISAIEAGASGYILKDALTSSVAAEIETLLQGGSALSPMVAKLLLNRFRATPSAAPNTTTNNNTPAMNATSQEILNPANIRLSPRETEVLSLIARGCSYAEVGTALKLSEETVSAHLRNIYKKLEVHSRSEAVYEASRLGLLRVT